MYLQVAIGGVLGAMARFALARRWPWAATSGLPWATLAVNLAGCVLLGFLVRALPAWGAGPGTRALLTVGFCGSFTTFSTFGYELVLLLQAGAYGTAALYLAASVALGVAGVALGLAIAPG